MIVSKETHQEQIKVTPLPDLKNKILAPLGGSNLSVDLNRLVLTRTFVGKEEYEAASDIVNYSYNSYYGNNGEVMDVAHDNLSELDTTITMIASQTLSNKSIILGSLRFIYGDSLEMFDLFEMNEGKKWPHEQNGFKKPGEIGKFSFHPILSEKGFGYSTKERTILKGIVGCMLYESGIQKMKEAGVEIPYFIFAKHVLDFAETAGVRPCIKVEGVGPKQSEEAIRIRQKFSKYWNPNSVEEYQPKLYIAPWKVQSPLI